MADNGGRGGGRGGGKRRGGGGGGDRVGKKGKYTQQTGLAPRAANGQALALGTRGVLVTCDQSKEDRAANEAATLFEEHYAKLFKDSNETSTSEPAVAAAGGTVTKDISALIAEEVAGLKDQSTKKFKTHHTGVKGCVYIVFPQEPDSPSPQEVVLSIVKEVKDTKTLPARNIVRLLPVTSTCFASLDEIKEMAPKLVTGHFPESGPASTFAVEYEHRSADNFDRMAVINSFVDLIKAPHTVNLNSPFKTVLVQLLRNGCGASVVEGYREYLRFNLRKLVEPDEDEATKKLRLGKEEAARSARAEKKAAEETKKAGTTATAASLTTATADTGTPAAVTDKDLVGAVDGVETSPVAAVPVQAADTAVAAAEPVAQGII